MWLAGRCRPQAEDGRHHLHEADGHAQTDDGDQAGPKHSNGEPSPDGAKETAKNAHAVWGECGEGRKVSKSEA